MHLDDAGIKPGKRVYAIGDIHGRLDLLDKMIEHIENDLAKRPIASHQIITVGDYCDRGPDSCSVIERLIKLSRDQNWICLRGNHDQYILDSVAEPDRAMDHWLRLGGRETLVSYGLTEIDRNDPFKVARDFSRKLPASHKAFIKNLPLFFVQDDYFFCHAGVRPGIALTDQMQQDLLWIREEFLFHKEEFEKIIVHGHTICERVDFHINRINIDTGAFFSGILSCVVLEANDQRLLLAAKP